MPNFLTCTLTLLQFLLRVSTTTSRVITQSQSIFNETTGTALFQQRSPNVLVTKAQNFTNGTLSDTPSTPSNRSVFPSSDFIEYKVTNSPTTLYFHTFGPVVPDDEVLESITEAVAICLRYVIGGRGRKPIAMGYFQYIHQFKNKDEVKFVVADFREDGRPMEYFILADVLKGIGEYMSDPKHGWTEVSFEVEVRKEGYVGTGHLDRRAAPSSAASLE